MGSYARLLGRPGFDPGNVVCEVEGRVELRHTDAQRLRIAADPTELAAFVARASSVLRPPPT